ncbi:unnamed protein product, partial [Symbiodinium sp. KB8]
MASSQSLFATIPGLEGLIAEPTHAALPPASLASAAAAPTPPRPVAPSPPGGSPFPPHPTPSSMASRGALLEGEGAPGSGHRVGSLADQREADAASLSPSKQAKEDGVAVAISLFSEDDESSHLLQRRLAFLAPGMQVWIPHPELCSLSAPLSMEQFMGAEAAASFAGRGDGAHEKLARAQATMPPRLQQLQRLVKDSVTSPFDADEPVF